MEEIVVETIYFLNFLAKLCCQISLTSALLPRVLPSALGLDAGIDDGADGATVRPISFCTTPISFCPSVEPCGRVAVNERDVHYGNPVLILLLIPVGKLES